MAFRELFDHELQALSDDQLIRYIRDARHAGEPAFGRRALMFLVYGSEPDVKRRLLLRVPSHVVDDVAHDIIVRAIAGAFDGTSEGEFRSWLHTIVDRGAVDFYRRTERRPKETILPSEHTSGDDAWEEEPFVESAARAVELRLVVEQLLGELTDRQRAVIELHVFSGLPAAMVCDRIQGMSEDNVAQIASRFRAKLRTRLDPQMGARA